MTATATNHRAGELVPMAERRRYLQVFRAVVVAAVVTVAAAYPQELLAPLGAILAACAVYAALSAAGHVTLARSGRRGLLVFGGMLMIDGVFLVWAGWATGGAASPVRLLVIPHLVTVSLLASYRTGVKLALWHSLLLLVVHYAQDGGVLAPAKAAAGLGTPMQELIAFCAVAWFATLATATFSAVNERELRRRRYDLEALARMTARLEAETEPEPVAGLLIDSIAATFGFRRLVALDLRDELATEVIVTHGLRTADGPAAADGRGALLAALEGTREPQLVAGLDPAADAWLAGLVPGARNLVAMPLVADSRVVGAIVAEHRTPRIERETLGMLERFTSHGALALANAWLLERVRRLADTDGLTGVANRRTFDATLARETARAARGQDDLSLVMLDVDRFKLLNDTYGHQTGDDVLKRVAAALEGCMRSFDTVARYGGEEFAVLLPRASAADAVSVAERLRRAIARSSTDPAVTVSAGVATFPVDAAEPADLVAAADAALYASKAAGRDCVTAASDVKPPARRRRPAGATPAKRRAKPKA